LGRIEAQSTGGEKEIQSKAEPIMSRNRYRLMVDEFEED